MIKSKITQKLHYLRERAAMTSALRGGGAWRPNADETLTKKNADGKKKRPRKKTLTTLPKSDK